MKISESSLVCRRGSPAGSRNCRAALEQALLDYKSLCALRLGPRFRSGIGCGSTSRQGCAQHGSRQWAYRVLPVARRHPEPPRSSRHSMLLLCPRGQCRSHPHTRENIEPEGEAPLAAGRVDARLAELRTLFEHARRTQHGVERAAGVSWLYNVPGLPAPVSRNLPGDGEDRGTAIPEHAAVGSIHRPARPGRAAAAAKVSRQAARLASMEVWPNASRFGPWRSKPLADFYAFHRIG